MARELQVWSPMRELERFRREFDDMFARFLGGRETALSGPPIESFVDGDRLIVRADLPGVDPKDVEVTVTGNILTLKGTRRYEHESKERDFIHREVSYGSFERSLTLPEGIKAEQVKASYRNGVLELTVPMPQSMAARKVPVEIGPGETKD
jgi:HSP20 family protein